MKIYTKTGDKGETSLLSGNRVPKNHIRIETYGIIDELSSYIGFLRGFKIEQEICDFLIFIQKKLFIIGSELSLDENIHNINIAQIKISDIELLEKEIDKYDKILPKLTKFIIPGGNKKVGLAHICRTISRKAERLIVALSQQAEININILKFINRLSDYFFTLSRIIAMNDSFEQIKY